MHVFDVHLGGPIDLGWVVLDSEGDVFGMFWANTARDSDGDKRDALCKAREIASNQALAAILNSSIPGGKTLPAGYSLTEIAAILYSNDIDAIKMMNTDLDAFNNSGEDVAFDPSLLPTGRADPNGARDIADIPFADCP